MNSNKLYDFIVVGQGLSGTIVAHELLKKKKSIMVINQELPGAASIVAAGIVNPITGRRFVKSWRIDELIPLALTTYEELEELLGISVIEYLDILRALDNVAQENDWLARCSDDEYSPYMGKQFETLNAVSKKVYRWARICHSFKIDLGLLLEKFSAFLAENEMLTTAVFEHSALQIEADFVVYKGIKSRKIIFCEGFRGVQNPFFDVSKMKQYKGEVFIIRTDALCETKKMLKDNLFFVPLGNNEYWVGAYNLLEFNDLNPSFDGENYLKLELVECIGKNFEILKHASGVRPTTIDRRPLVFESSISKNLIFFNGMGSKGTSLIPYFAKILVNNL